MNSTIFIIDSIATTSPSDWERLRELFNDKNIMLWHETVVGNGVIYIFKDK